MNPVWSVAAVALAYIIGSFPTGYLIVKWRTGEDIRRHGSGGTGATNVRRLAGSGWARVALITDLLKGFFPVWFAQRLFPDEFWLHAIIGFAVVLGHSKSLFLGFTGGKSAASGLGTMMAMDWRVALIAAALAYVVTRLTRVVSIGSLAAAGAAPIAMLAFGAPWAYSGYTALASLYVVWTHRQNIARLRQGTENKLE